MYVWPLTNNISALFVSVVLSPAGQMRFQAVRLQGPKVAGEQQNTKNLPVRLCCMLPACRPVPGSHEWISWLDVTPVLAIAMAGCSSTEVVSGRPAGRSNGDSGLPPDGKCFPTNVVCPVPYVCICCCSHYAVSRYLFLDFLFRTTRSTLE